MMILFKIYRCIGESRFLLIAYELKFIGNMKERRKIMNEKLEKYPKTDKFSITDILGVPHTYCITDKHIQYSTGIYLNIEEAEKKGAKCGVKGCNLKYEQHEQVLLVKSEVDPVNNEDLMDYLRSINAMCTSDGFIGFTILYNDRLYGGS